MDMKIRDLLKEKETPKVASVEKPKKKTAKTK